MDFALILVSATAFTGLVWALDGLLWRRRRAPDADEPVLVDYSRSFFPLLVLVLVLRSFVAEPFRIPSGSMIPTLLVGDFILVNKHAYGLRLPVLETEIWNTGRPERGDVVVFRYPEDPDTRYIKRVVGLPGDRISYRGIQLFVNGEGVPMVPDGVYAGSRHQGARIYQEEIAGVRHPVLDLPGRTGPQVDDFVVPEGHYYVMGDNRDSSNDSRRWGPVPEENLVGRAFLVWMNWESPTVAPVWDRIGESID